MRRSLVAVSLVVHVAVILTLFVTGMWRLDRIEAGKRHVDLAIAAQPPEAPAGGAARAVPEFQHKPRPPRVARDPVQPTPRPEIAPEIEPIPGDGSGTGSGSDVGPGSGSGSAASTGSCTDDCGRAPAAPPLRTLDKPIIVPPSVLRELRISGETQIQPPDVVKTTMMRDGVSRAIPGFRVCVSVAGEVYEVTTLRSSRYADYDAVLVDNIRRWRYRPYVVDGRPTPACSVVTFVYDMK